jgi:hypothetical protein
VTDKDNNAVTKADRKFAKGAQVFEDYGQPNSIYLTYHGFSLGRTNQHHCVQVQHKYLALSEQYQANKNNEQPLCVHVSAPVAGVKSTAVHAKSSNNKVWEQLARLGLTNREKQLKALQHAAKMQLDAYPTTVVSELIMKHSFLF